MPASIVMARALDNYIRTYRRLASLSQDELAFLLGSRDGSKVSRYEQHKRRPSFVTAAACELVFQVPTRELFAGVYQEIEQKVRQRAQKLLTRLTDCARPSAALKAKLALLQRLQSGPRARS